MRKFTLLVISCWIGTLAFAQNTKTMRIANPKLSIDLSRENLLLQPSDPTVPALHFSQGTRDLDYVVLGSSGNGLSVLNNQCNVIAADNSLQTVVFIHRNNGGVFGGTSSQYRFDVSKDGGLSFLNDIGPLNPVTDGNGVGGINGRYPQCALTNPSGAGVADSIYLAYIGTWHNGESTVNTWDGSISGVAKVDGSPSSFREVIDSVNHGEVGILTAMCNGKPGEFWTISPVWDEDDIDVTYNDSNYVVMKGVWNAAARNVDWIISKILTLPPELTYVDPTNGENLTYDLNPLIAFDPTGMKGWICIGGDFISDGLYVYQPVFISTNDGGASWSEPTYLDLTSLDNVMLDLDPSGSGIPSTAYEADLVVDLLGNPHYVNMIGSGIDYGFQSGLKFHAYDITRKNGNWEALRLDADSIATFRGNIGSGAGGVVYTEDNRCQATTTPDGSKVFFSWIDTDPSLIDPNADYDNIYPNLFAIGLDVNTGQFSPLKNISYATEYDGKCILPNLAPTCLRNEVAASSIIPVAIIDTDPNSSFETAKNFVYFSNVTFNDADFPVGINNEAGQQSFSVGANYPNPFTSSTQFTIQTEKASDIKVKVQNMLGATISEKDYNFASGKHTISLSKGSMASGVYFYTVSDGNKSITHKMVVE